jgi:predicted nucleotidyltransferase
MKMLDLEQIDLSTLAEALEDHSEEATWWLDPGTGEVQLWSEYLSSEDEGSPGDRGLIQIEPLRSRVGYGDMEDFIGRLGDVRARDLLQRAIEGRGAFRRFKDTLLEFPDLRAAWFAFHDARTERRALEWLADEGIVDPEIVEAEIKRRADPEVPELGPGPDPDTVARAVAKDLRVLYGPRLRRVVLFGSWARHDAHPDSDIDLLVVLDRVDSVWEELRRMEPIAWRHSHANDAVVSVTPVGDEDLRAGRRALLRRAQAEGRQVA